MPLYNSKVALQLAAWFEPGSRAAKPPLPRGEIPHQTFGHDQEEGALWRSNPAFAGRALSGEACLERFIEDFTRTWSDADRQVHRERRRALESAGYR